MALMRKIIIVLLISFITNSFAGMQNLVNVTVGPIWPKDVKGTSWNIAGEYGLLIDKIVGAGVKLDFGWDTREDEEDLSNGTTIVTYKRSHFMVPVSGFLSINPIPHNIVQPVFRAQVGYNSIFLNEENWDKVNEKWDDSNYENGYYGGMITKIGLDGLYELGELSAVVLGFEWQFAEVKRKVGENTYKKLNLGGPALRAGFNIIF